MPKIEAINARFMELALDEARLAPVHGDVPVGAVVVHGDQVLGRGHNRREVDRDPMAHAEVLALQMAARELGHWRLDGARLYVTLEPCPMCAGALVNARVDAVIFGCADPKAGAVRTLYALCDDPRLNHRLTVTRGVLADRSAELLTTFFADLRERKRSGGAAPA